MNGQWRLRITDSNGNDRSGVLEQWSLIVERSPVAEQEFRVNTTSAGNQTYSSVAMDHQGEFVVTWSGFGDQPEHEDLSGSGVFLQRFEATGNRIGDESRVNMTTEGDQAIPSVSSDGVGNYYVAFTGVRRDAAGNNIPGETDVYVLASNSTLILQDNDPPIVTDVQLADGTRLLQGDVVPSSTDQLLVMFGESMSLKEMTSVENVDNWELERNGSELTNGIESVDFRFNTTTRKYEAELTLSTSVLPLAAGEYQLTVSSVVTDNINSLDGDQDGIPGSNPTTTTQPGYQFRFNVSNSDGVSVGAEHLVNQVTSYEDRFSAAYGTGTARETSSTTLAVDHDGDYVVVWTRYGADDPNDSSGAGVYMRLYNRDDEPLTDEFLVNTFTEGHQRNPSVAMDADGDFIVVWESIDGGSGNLNVDDTYDIYARRFSAAGTPLDFHEYRVNTELTGHQVNPAVATDDAGNFVIVWATAGQDFSFYNDVKGQMFRRITNELGDYRSGAEFLVNSFDVPGVGAIGTSGFEINPSVAMGGISGDVVVAWEVVTAQQDGAVTDTEIAARIFNRSADGTVFPSNPEFVAHEGSGAGGADTERVARNPQLAMDDQDGFIIVWESYTGTDYDVFYQEFTSAGTAIVDAQVNMTQFGGQQVNPSVGIDADGDFAIVFNGNGAQPDPLAPGNTALYASEDTEGIWLRSYDAANESVSVQSRVNIVEGGIQQFPTIGVEPDGDMIVAWSGRGVGDQHGIFVRRYNEATDTAGPRATELRLTDGTLIDTDPGADPQDIPNDVAKDQLVVIFDEELWNVAGHTDRVTNPDTWRLERGGVNISDQITSIDFALDDGPGGSNKWEATVTLDSDLQEGTYTLEVRPPVEDIPGTDEDEGESGIRDAVGNPLGQDGLNPDGQTYSMQFRLGSASTGGGGADRSVTQTAIGFAPTVTDAQTHFETPNAVAVDDDGDYVVVLTAVDDEPTSPNYGRDRVYYRVYSPDGVAKTDLKPVTPDAAFAGDTQSLASVATDADGDFIVTWTNSRNGDADIYARRFNAAGTPLDAAFRVNAYQVGTQIWSDVAMDIDGDFVITWSSDGQEQAEDGAPASDYGVYARRYDSQGSALSSEFRVNWSTVGNQRMPSVAMDSGGGFYIVWASDGNGEGEDIVGRAYYPDGSPIPFGLSIFPEDGINDPQNDREGNQLYPDVAINQAGNSVIVTWSAVTDSSDGWDVFGAKFAIVQDPLVSGANAIDVYVSQDPNLPTPLPDPGTYRSPLVITDSFLIDDINVGLTITHPDPRDLVISLISPAGTEVELASLNPTGHPSWRSGEPYEPDDPLYLPVDGNGYITTTFDDEADNSITEPFDDPPAVAPFSDFFVPEERLRAFDNELTNGTWYLEVRDTRAPFGDPADINGYPWVRQGGGVLEEWSLTITQKPPVNYFQVNDTTEGNQLFSSVAADQNGGFVIAWSGQGDQEFEEDPEGVFYKRYDAGATSLVGETSVTPKDDVRQWLPSVGSDAEGNFVIGYTSDDDTLNSNGSVINTDVHVFRSQEHVSVTDDAHPVVTDVLLPTGERLFNETSVRTTDLAGNQLTVLFSEEMALTGPRTNDYPLGAPHPGSVENVANWNLSRNGTDLPLAITDIDFSFNQQLQKYQAVLTLDGQTTWALGEGEFVLTALNTLHDARIDPEIDPDADPNSDPYFGANRLAGNFDLGPHVAPGQTGDRPYTHTFYVVDASSVAPSTLLDLDGEFNVSNDFDNSFVDRIGEPSGTGQGQEGTQRAAAIDDDGDMAIVWTRYLNETSSNPSDIYLRLVGRNDTAGTEILVNDGIYQDGIQRNATVAMDADGDLIVAWESLSTGAAMLDDIDIYARRYDAVGNALGEPFLVNHESGPFAAGAQAQPSVAMDDYGNSIIVWTSRADDEFTYFTDIYGQRYDSQGVRIGTEFQINVVSLPGTSLDPGGPDVNPTVALHESGEFVVAWEQITSQQNGVERDMVIVARQFDANGRPLTVEDEVANGTNDFIADDLHDPLVEAQSGDDVNRTARNPQISMDAAGNFIVVWESYQDNDMNDTGVADSYGIYFREFFADPVLGADGSLGTLNPARTNDHQANLVITTDGQSFPDTRVNADKFALSQVNPSIGVDADGDFAIVWNGNGATADSLDPTSLTHVADADMEGVFVREFHAGLFDPNNPVSEDEDVYVSPQSRVNQTGGGIQQFPTIVMEPDGDYAVVWSGSGVGERQGIYFRRYQSDGDAAGPLATELRTESNELVAEGDHIFVNPTKLKVVFNEEMYTAGGASGFYSVMNPDNWALVDGNGAEMVGAISNINFGLNGATNKWEAEVVFNTAMYGQGLDNGFYTLIARTNLKDVAGNPLARTGLQPQGSNVGYWPATSPTGGMGFSFRVYELTPGDPTTHDVDMMVNTTELGDKVDPAIARNATGRHVVVWTEEISATDTTSPSTEIYARVFQASANGVYEPVLNHYGSNEAFRVNSLTTADQVTADVAIDDNGNFVVVWSGVGVSALGEQDDQGIFGQLFGPDGDPIGGQFGINQTADGIQDAPAVAMDAAGNYVVTWQSHEQGGIMARKFYASGASTSEFLVNSTTGNNHKTPDVAMDNQGEFAVTWAADQQDAGSFGVFAQRYTANAAKTGGEFQVNQFETNQQEKPRIAMDDNGAFVIAWQSFGQDAFGGYGVYARRYDANGNAASSEFRVNQETASYQFEPSVAMDKDGAFVVTWSSFNQEGDQGELYGIFARMYDANGNDFLVNGQVLGEYRVNAIVEGDQRNSDVAMDADGHYVVVWEGDSEKTLQLSDDTFATIEQTDIYARFVDPPATLSTDGKTLDLIGTPTQDTFEFVAGATPGSWVIKINGEVYTAASTVDTINFDGMGGNDIVTLTGTSGAEKAYLRPGSVTFEGTNFTLNATNVENVTVDGQGGQDFAELLDSSGDDFVLINVGVTTMEGPGFVNGALNFEEVQVYGTNGGYDEARLRDSSGKDTFTSTTGWSLLEGPSYLHKATGFEIVHAYSSGGTDVAMMHDGPYNDKFKYYKNQAKMYAGGYVRAKNFPEIHAIADGGGDDDYARIFDTKSVDMFVGTPTSARMYSTQAKYDVTAELFERVLAYSVYGGTDSAQFTDTAAKEIFRGHSHKAEFFNNDFEITARRFENVKATSTPGSGDIAKFRDTTGDDHLIFDETSARMYTKNGEELELLYEALAFDLVKTYRSSGNDTTDVAESVEDYLKLDEGWDAD